MTEQEFKLALQEEYERGYEDGLNIGWAIEQDKLQWEELNFPGLQEETNPKVEIQGGDKYE